MKEITPQEMRDLANYYWRAFSAGEKEIAAGYLKQMNECEAVERVINERGNQVIRRKSKHHDRYQYDLNLCRPSDGWEQFDTHQDAPYFGMWVNKRKLTTVTYCEGDETTVICPDAEHYNAEIEDACQFYEEGNIGIAISGKGQTTVYRQDRKRFFIGYVAPPEVDEMEKVPFEIRTASQLIRDKFDIKGICDPMYICNLIATELNLGDGMSNFGKTGEYTSDDVRRVANRINHAYSTCMKGGDCYPILKELF